MILDRISEREDFYGVTSPVRRIAQFLVCELFANGAGWVASLLVRMLTTNPYVMACAIIAAENFTFYRMLLKFGSVEQKDAKWFVVAEALDLCAIRPSLLVLFPWFWGAGIMPIAAASLTADLVYYAVGFALKYRLMFFGSDLVTVDLGFVGPLPAVV